LVEECIKNNVLVTAVVRPDSPNIYRLPSSKLLNIVACDMNEYYKLPSHKKPGETFYHFAWSVTDSSRDQDLMDNIKYRLYFGRGSDGQNIGCSAFIGAGSQAEYGIKKKWPVRNNCQSIYTVWYLQICSREISTESL
jgi:hypothetical protein